MITYTHLSRLFFGLALTFTAQADVITYSSVLTGLVNPSSKHGFNYSGAFNVPKFNPSLGTLNSISFTVGQGGQLPGGSPGVSMRTEVISIPKYQGYIDYSVRVATSFLGAIAELSDGTVPGTSDSVCGIVGGNPVDARPCNPSASSLGTHMNLLGTIAGDSSSINAKEPWTQQKIVGSPAVGLVSFIGSGTLTLPISISVEAIPSGARGVFGGLIGKQAIRANLKWTYHYTPANR